MPSYKNVNGQPVELTPAEETARAQQSQADVAEHVPIQFKFRRAAAYGSIGDQLDMMYWDQINGTTTWKDHITAVKTNIPEPE